MAKPKRIRLNLEFTPETHGQMKRLMIDTNAASLTEVIRKAIALYSIVVSHQSVGGELVLKNHDGSQEKLWIL